MKDLNKLNKEARIVFLLFLTQLVIDNLADSEGYDIAVNALQRCWDWVFYKNIEAFDLYDYLGNDDENDVTTFMLSERRETQQKAWLCVDVVLSITIQNAFEYENQKIVPEDIETLNIEEEMDKTIEFFWDSFTKIYDNTAVVDNLFLQMTNNYPMGTDKSIKKEDLKSCIDLIQSECGNENLF